MWPSPIPPIFMTLLDASDDKLYLEKIISALPKYTEDQATEANKNGKLNDGECFLFRNEPINAHHWKAGVFVKGKLIFVDYDEGVYDRKRFEILKRKGIARLLHIADTKWVPTAQMPYLPQRYQNIESGKVLYTAEAIEGELEDARHDNAVIDPEFHAV